MIFTVGLDSNSNVKHGRLSSYPGLESEDHFRQEQYETFELDGEIFQHKIGYSNSPDQVKEIKTLDVWLRKDKAGGKYTNIIYFITVIYNNII